MLFLFSKWSTGSFLEKNITIVHLAQHYFFLNLPCAYCLHFGQHTILFFDISGCINGHHSSQGFFLRTSIHRLRHQNGWIVPQRRDKILLQNAVYCTVVLLLQLDADCADRDVKRLCPSRHRSNGRSWSGAGAGSDGEFSADDDIH